MDIEQRKLLVEKIESDQNKGRKVYSYKASEVINDRIKQYVIDELRGSFEEDAIREMPVISSINIAKRIVNQLNIYKEKAEREFHNMTDDQKEVMHEVYNRMAIDKKMRMANKFYKNHDQCLIQILPKHGSLIMRVLKPHQWDVIQDPDDPEKAMAYIISPYDKTSELMEASRSPQSATGFQTTYASSSDSYKTSRSFKEKEKQSHKRYLIWTREENFMIDGRGEIVGEVLPNPLAEWGMMPFVEVSTEKEFEYWVRAQNSFAEFTVEFNARLSELAQVVKMQGFSQAILKGPKDIIVDQIKIGPTRLLKLVNDTASGIETDFSYATPNSDIAGSLQFLETLLVSFLSSNGIDPKTVTLSGDGQKYTSGLERLLAMIEKLQASKEDFDTFYKAEKEIFKLVRAWLWALNNTETLDAELHADPPKDSKCVIEFAKPEMVTDEREQLDIISKKIELGISSPIEAIMQREKLTREEAEERHRIYMEDSGFGDREEQGTAQTND